MKMQILSMLIFLTALGHADSGSANIIRWTSEVQETAVEETGRLEIFDRPAPGKQDDNTFAGHAAEPGKRFQWIPSTDPLRGGGGARIPDAALSEDGTALILLETVGSADGPFDTRIVILDVRTGNIVQVRRLARIRCTRLLTIPKAREILLAAPQENGDIILLCYSPKSDKILEKKQCRAFSDWCIAGPKLLLKNSAKRALRVCSLPKLKTERLISTRYPGGILLAAPSGKILNAAPKLPSGTPAAATVPWILEKIDLDAPKSQQDPRDRFMDFPEGFRPDAALLCGRKHQLSVWLAHGGAAYLLDGGDFHPMADRVTGTGTGHAGDTLFLGLQKEDMLGEFHPEESTALIRSTRTGGNAPRTRGEVLKIFPGNDAKPSVIILDHRANVYTMQPPVKGRKWKKTILFTPGDGK